MERTINISLDTAQLNLTLLDLRIMSQRFTFTD